MQVQTTILIFQIDLRTPAHQFIDVEMAKTAIEPLIEIYGSNFIVTETSAVTGENVEQLFDAMIGQIIEFNFTQFADSYIPYKIN